MQRSAVAPGLVALRPARGARPSAAELADAIDRRWPLAALLAWTLAWGLYLGLARAQAPLWLAASLAAAAGALLALPASTLTRRVIVVAGFPVSLAATGVAAALPAWVWLPPLALLVLAYPLKAWRDAPWFPTPHAALDELATLAPLAMGARVLDAGCGLGHGLAALQRAYPEARLEGIECSRPLALLAALRCGYAKVRLGDFWHRDWSFYALVYLFQRPESLPRAIAKARAELKPGAWLASLEFPAADLVPQAVGRAPDGRPVWLYRAPFKRVFPAPDAESLRRRGFSLPAERR